MHGNMNVKFILWLFRIYKTQQWGEVHVKYYKDPSVDSDVRPVTENTDGRANSLTHGRDVLIVPYKIRKL
jgi:hypothetical protein